MAEAVFVQPGKHIDHIPAADVAQGEVVLIGNLVTVAPKAILLGELGSVTTEGVFTVEKADDPIEFAAGDAVYWDAAANKATSVAAGNTFMGFALLAAVAAATTVRIALRSLQTTAAETLALADLSDVGATAYTAGQLLVGDGDSFEDQALSGPFVLSATGKLTIASATVAAAGDSQATAAAVAEGFTLVSASDGTKGVKLPAAAEGQVCIIKNNVAATLAVYPNTGDAINAIAANTAITLANLVACVFVAYDATTWYTVPLLPS